MSVDNYHDLRSHIGHHLVCTYYGNEDDPVNVAVECEDCHEVIIDFDRDPVEEWHPCPHGSDRIERD